MLIKLFWFLELRCTSNNIGGFQTKNFGIDHQRFSKLLNYQVSSCDRI